MPVHSGRLSGDKPPLSTRHKSDRLHLIWASWLPHFLRVVVAKYRGHRGQTGKVRLTLCQRCIFLAPLEQGPALYPQGPPGPNASGKVRGRQVNSWARSGAMIPLAGVVHLRQQVGPQFGPCQAGGQGLPLAPAFGRRGAPQCRPLVASCTRSRAGRVPPGQRGAPDVGLCVNPNQQAPGADRFRQSPLRCDTPTQRTISRTFRTFPQLHR